MDNRRAEYVKKAYAIKDEYDKAPGSDNVNDMINDIIESLMNDYPLPAEYSEEIQEAMNPLFIVNIIDLVDDQAYVTCQENAFVVMIMRLMMSSLRIMIAPSKMPAWNVFTDQYTRYIMTPKELDGVA